jgi:hypothetical protein
VAGKVGHALSFGFAVDPAMFGLGKPGNTGKGQNISIGNFLWVSKTPPIASSPAASKLMSRIRSTFQIGPGRGNGLVMNKVTMGGSVSPGGGIHTGGAGWVGAAAGSNIVFGPAGPDKQKTAGNKLLARNAPTISAALWIAPPQTYYNFNWKTTKTAPPPAPPTASAPPFVQPPPFVDPGRVPPAGKRPPTTNPAGKPLPNQPTSGLRVELAPNMLARYGQIDYVQVLDRAGRVISTTNPKLLNSAVNVDLRGKTGVQRIRVVTNRGAALNFMLSGLGTTLFSIDRRPSAQKINAGFGTIGAYTDSKLGWNRINIGSPDRRLSQPSAVFHVAPPKNARPGTLKIEAHYFSAANVAQHQLINDNDARDIDRNPGIIKRDARYNRGVLVVVSYISRITGKRVYATVSISQVGNAKSRISATGIPLNSKNGPKVYFNNYYAHTVDLGNLP